MRQFLTILNLLLLVLLIMGMAQAQKSDLRKVKIQIYREGPEGQQIKKDTIVMLKDLDAIQELMGELGIEENNSGAFLADKRNVTIQSNETDSTKQISIVRIQGDNWQDLDSATQAKVNAAFEVANITPQQNEDKSVDPNAPKASENQYVVGWDSTVLTSDDFQKKEVILQKKDFSEKIEKNLEETLNEGEVKSLLTEMDVNIQISGERPTPASQQRSEPVIEFHVNSLQEKDYLLLQPFEKAGLTDTLQINHLTLVALEDIYILSFDLDQTGDMAVYIRDVTGNLIFQDIQKSFQGNYRSEVELSKGLGTLLFLNIAQNGKMKTYKITKTEIQK